MSDRYERIREALNMGPTPGPWSFKDNRDGSINLFGDGRLFSPSCRLMNKPANEAYISACDPDTIRELLAERDALAADNERLREALSNLLVPFADDECRKDHHGYCQAHFLEEDCCVAAARRALEGGKSDE